MSFPLLLIEVLWSFIAMTLIIQYIEALKEISSLDRFIACMIFILGAPFFLIVNVLETLLNCIFPEGWDNDDYFKGY